jgi:hypothetical protein
MCSPFSWAEERAPDAAETPHLLNHQQRIKVKSLPEWNFGIYRYVSPIAELLPLLDALYDAKEWRGSGQPLHAGEPISAPLSSCRPTSARRSPGTGFSRTTSGTDRMCSSGPTPKRRPFSPCSTIPGASRSFPKRFGLTHRLVVRPSGTEPVIRVMGEGDDKAMVEEIVDSIVDALTDQAA